MYFHYKPHHYLREALDWNGPEGTKENGYLLQRELGKLYGKSSHDVGKALKAIGLRDADGHPTAKAFQLELVAPRGSPKFTWAWHLSTTALLDIEAGWETPEDDDLE